MQRNVIFYLHGNPWDGVWGRQQHLMSALTKYADIIYFENVEVTKYRISHRQPQPGITVVSGVIPLWNRLTRRGMTCFIKPLLTFFTRHFYRKSQRTILWSAENCLKPYRYFKHDSFIYDCIDPCFSDDQNERLQFELRETENCRRADLVFASAASLLNNCSKHGKPVYLVNNAAPQMEWRNRVHGQRPAWWPNNDRIAVYLGTLDRRIDISYIARSAMANCNVEHVLAGNIALPSEALSDLRPLSNVSIPGRVSDEVGEFIIANCAVGMIPFRCGDMNDGVNPVKLYYYAMHGKQIVSTNVAEVASRPEVASSAKSPEEFAALIASAVAHRDDDVRRRYRMAYANRNTWAERAEEVWTALDRHSLVLR